MVRQLLLDTTGVVPGLVRAERACHENNSVPARRESVRELPHAQRGDVRGSRMHVIENR